MKFIKIGKFTLNVAQIAEIKDESPDLVKVKMVGFLGSPLPFKGDDAVAIRDFFASESCVVDITPEASMEAHS